MRIVLQRVKEARVIAEGRSTGSIQHGLLLLVGFREDDQEEQIQPMAEKIVNLRIFEDEAGKMNGSLLDVKGSILSVSQFTLYGDSRKGRRPSFDTAAKSEIAFALYEKLNQSLSTYGIPVETGVFGAYMEVSLINDGPVTLILESR
jgi:D-aminoacyl-tRNA deacylase